MPTGVTIRGDATFVATMTSAQAKMKDLPGIQDAASEIAWAAGDEAPRYTGRLAASITTVKDRSGAGTITSPLVYAIPIHWGRPAHNIAANPFIMRAADREESRWVDKVERSAQSALNMVRGI